MNNAWDSMKRSDQIITEMSQLPNQEAFYVPAGGQRQQQMGASSGAQTLADMY